MVLPLSLLVGQSLLVSWAQGGIPPSTNPGLILQQQQRDMWYRQHAPWLYGPITEEDLSSPEEPVIEFHDMNVDAQIVSPDYSPEQENDLGE